jgi:hypothetical protein
VAEQTALQVRAEIAPDEARHYALSLARVNEMGLELVANDRIERRLFGRAPRVHRGLCAACGA